MRNWKGIRYSYPLKWSVFTLRRVDSLSSSLLLMLPPCHLTHSLCELFTSSATPFWDLNEPGSTISWKQDTLEAQLIHSLILSFWPDGDLRSNLLLFPFYSAVSSTSSSYSTHFWISLLIIKVSENAHSFLNFFIHHISVLLSSSAQISSSDHDWGMEWNALRIE